MSHVSSWCLWISYLTTKTIFLHCRADLFNQIKQPGICAAKYLVSSDNFYSPVPCKMQNRRSKNAPNTNLGWNRFFWPSRYVLAVILLLGTQGQANHSCSFEFVMVMWLYEAAYLPKTGSACLLSSPKNSNKVLHDMVHEMLVDAHYIAVCSLCGYLMWECHIHCLHFSIVICMIQKSKRSDRVVYELNLWKCPDATSVHTKLQLIHFNF